VPVKIAEVGRIDHLARARGLLEVKPILGQKIALACEVDGAQVVDGLVEVLRFMELTRIAEGTLTPSPRVDDVWHELILCTRQYAEYCRAHLGRFVHHDPGGSDDLNRARFRETLRLYNLCFGMPDPKWWGEPSAISAVADCGPCESAKE
jgi:hypothetical protein